MKIVEKLFNVIKSQGQMKKLRFVCLQVCHLELSIFILNFKDYGVYLEDNGHTLRGLFIIDDKGTLRQVNNSFFSLEIQLCIEN